MPVARGVQAVPILRPSAPGGNVFDAWGTAKRADCLPPWRVVANDTNVRAGDTTQEPGGKRQIYLTDNLYLN